MDFNPLIHVFTVTCAFIYSVEKWIQMNQPRRDYLDKVAREAHPKIEQPNSLFSYVSHRDAVTVIKLLEKASEYVGINNIQHVLDALLASRELK